MYCLIDIDSKIIAQYSCTLNLYFLTSLRYKWHLFNELIRITSRIFLYIFNQIFLFQRGLYHPHLCLKSNHFNLVKLIKLRSINPRFVGTAKVRIFSILSRVFLSFFSFLSKPKNKTPQHSSFLYNLSMYYPANLA